MITPTEFLNHQFVQYLQARQEKVAIERGRPYRMNDQCYVEQKNFTHVRELFGADWRIKRKSGKVTCKSNLMKIFSSILFLAKRQFL